MFVRTRLYAMPVVCTMCVMGGRDSWAQVESPQPGEGTTTPSNPPSQVRDIEVPRDRPRTLRVIPDTSPESGLQDEVRVPKEGLDLNLYLGGPEALAEAPITPSNRPSTGGNSALGGTSNPYIDNAVPLNRLMVRYDAADNNNIPDRANSSTPERTDSERRPAREFPAAVDLSRVRPAAQPLGVLRSPPSALGAQPPLHGSQSPPSSSRTSLGFPTCRWASSMRSSPIRITFTLSSSGLTCRRATERPPWDEPREPGAWPACLPAAFGTALRGR